MMKAMGSFLLLFSRDMTRLMGRDLPQGPGRAMGWIGNEPVWEMPPEIEPSPEAPALQQGARQGPVHPRLYGPFAGQAGCKSGG